MKPLDKHDLKVLASLSEDGFSFLRGYHAELRAYDLEKRGYVEKKFDVYRVTAGRKSVEIRNSYRRTEAGSKALDSVGARTA